MRPTSFRRSDGMIALRIQAPPTRSELPAPVKITYLSTTSPERSILLLLSKHAPSRRVALEQVARRHCEWHDAWALNRRKDIHDNT